MFHECRQSYGQRLSCGDRYGTRDQDQRRQFVCTDDCTNLDDSTSHKPMGCNPYPIRSCMDSRPNGRSKTRNRSRSSNADDAIRCLSTMRASSSTMGNDKMGNNCPKVHRSSWPNADGMTDHGNKAIPHGTPRSNRRYNLRYHTLGARSRCRSDRHLPFARHIQPRGRRSRDTPVRRFAAACSTP